MKRQDMMGICESVGVPVHICKLGSRWKIVVSFILL